MFTVIGTETYLKEIEKWPKLDREAVKKIPLQLQENPLVGKPLSYRFLREKKVREKRVYYLVYDDLHLVLLVATSGKKDQQNTINHLKEQLKEFRSIAEELAKQVF
jgi:mRNA-degrading endonuclease RelE of RelBE toxin-antitoxin system